MPYFAARPKYILHFQNNMKWFSHYEVKENNKEWTRIDGNNYEWELNEGINSIAVRGVNEAENKGIPSFLKIKYSAED